MNLVDSLKRGFAWSFEVLFWSIVVLAAATLVLGFMPSVTNRQLLAVSGGSMEPAFSAGDALLVRPLDDPARQVRIGDVIVLAPSPESASRAHRVVMISTDASGETMFRTSGDANAAPDPVWVSSAAARASVVASVPRLGEALRFLSEPWARLLLFVLPVVILAGRELWRGLRPDEEERSVLETA